MPYQPLNFGHPDMLGDGQTAHSAFQAINAMLQELFARIAAVDGGPDLSGEIADLQAQIDALLTAPRRGPTVLVASTLPVPMLPASWVFSGVSLEVGESILLAGQTNPSENGVYIRGGAGLARDPALAWADYYGLLVTVAAGTYAGHAFVSLSGRSGTLGVSPLLWRDLGVDAAPLVPPDLTPYLRRDGDTARLLRQIQDPVEGRDLVPLDHLRANYAPRARMIEVDYASTPRQTPVGARYLGLRVRAVVPFGAPSSGGMGVAISTVSWDGEPRAPMIAFDSPTPYRCWATDANWPAWGAYNNGGVPWDTPGASPYSPTAAGHFDPVTGLLLPGKTAPLLGLDCGSPVAPRSVTVSRVGSVGAARPSHPLLIDFYASDTGIFGGEEIAIGSASWTAADWLTTLSLTDTLSWPGSGVPWADDPGARGLIVGSAGDEWAGALTDGTVWFEKDNADPARNGIWIVHAGGWTRHPDCDSWGQAVDLLVRVRSGATLAGTRWASQAEPGGTLGVDPLLWAPFEGAAPLQGGEGITIDGVTVSVAGLVRSLARLAGDGVLLRQGTNLTTLATIPVELLPPQTITSVSVVASQADMLALPVAQGGVAVRTDLQSSFILRSEPASSLGNWQALPVPPDHVLSVHGRVGAVLGSAGDYMAGQIGVTPDGSLPETDAQSALARLAAQLGRVPIRPTDGAIRNYAEVMQSMSVAGPVTLPDPVGGQYYVATLTGDATLTLPTVASGSDTTVTLYVLARQDATGGHTLSWLAPPGDRLAWDQNAVPAATTAASAATLFVLTRFTDLRLWLGARVWKEV